VNKFGGHSGGQITFAERSGNLHSSTRHNPESPHTSLGTKCESLSIRNIPLKILNNGAENRLVE